MGKEYKYKNKRKYSLTQQKRAKSCPFEIRPGPNNDDDNDKDDSDDGDDDASREEGVNSSSQKECSPRSLHTQVTALGCPWEPLPDIYYVWFYHVLLTMVPPSPESMKYRNREMNPLLSSWDWPKA